MSTFIVILGAGGHTGVLLDILQREGRLTVLSVLDTNPALVGKKIAGIPIEGEEKIVNYPPQKVYLVNGLGSADIPARRESVFNQFKALRYSFFSVIHPSAIVSETATLGEGVHLMAGSIVQPGSRIGRNVLVNTRVTIEHDCKVGDHCHLASGVLLSGRVVIGETCHIGTGAVIIQETIVDNRALVGAGSVVIHDVMAGTRVAGVPAKQIGVNVIFSQTEIHYA